MVDTQMPSRGPKYELGNIYAIEMRGVNWKGKEKTLLLLGPHTTIVPLNFTRSAYLSYCWESNDKAIHRNTDSILSHCFLLKPYQHLLFLVDLLFSENSIFYTSYILVLKSTSKVKSYQIYY